MIWAVSRYRIDRGHWMACVGILSSELPCNVRKEVMGPALCCWSTWRAGLFLAAYLVDRLSHRETLRLPTSLPLRTHMLSPDALIEWDLTPCRLRNHYHVGPV